MKNKVCKWIERILSIDLIVAILCLSVLVLLTFTGAMARYFFKSPLFWQEEVQQGLIVWTIFCGCSYGFRKGSHICVDMLVDKFPAKWQTVMAWFGYACTMAALGFFLVQSAKLNLQFINTGKLTTTLRIPQWISYSMATIGTFWMMISATYNMVKRYILKIEDNEEDEEGGEQA